MSDDESQTNAGDEQSSVDHSANNASFLSKNRLIQSLQGDGLRAKALRGTAWTIAGFGTSQVLRLGSNLILTRLLFPEAFGLMALANVFLIGLQMFSDIGIGPSIIQSERGDKTCFLNTAWTMSIIRGAALALVSLTLAYPISLFYNEPILHPILSIIGFSAAVRGFQSTGFATCSRKLHFRRLITVELVSQIAGILVMITWAMITPTVWSLVGGGITTSLLSVILGHKFLSTHPHRIRWDRDSAQELVKFGRWIFVSTAITFLAQSGDKAFLPKILDIKDLSFYTIALVLANLSNKIFHQISSRVLFPIYSQLVRERNLDQIGESYKKFAYASMPIYAIPISMMIFGPLIIQTLYDDRYFPAGFSLSLLATGSCFQMMRSSQDSLLLALGFSKKHMTVVLSRLIAWIIGAAILTPIWKLEGFCASMIIAEAVALQTQRHFTRKHISSLPISPDITLLSILLFFVLAQCAILTNR